MNFNNLGKMFNESLNNAVGPVKDMTSNIEIPDLKEMGNKATEQVMSVFQKNPADSAKSAEASAHQEITSISCKGALKAIYYLMAADGEIYHGEEEKFDEMGKEFLSDFENQKESIIAECQATLKSVIDPEDLFDVLRDGTDNALRDLPQPGELSISPKLLIWDLLTVAYSDGNYDENERRLLKYVVRKLNVDKAVFLEMESSILTLLDIVKEMEWIKTTDRPYLKIEETIKELEKRKTTLVNNVTTMISLSEV